MFIRMRSFGIVSVIGNAIVVPSGASRLSVILNQSMAIETIDTKDMLFYPVF
jgi:hypothetical protein